MEQQHATATQKYPVGLAGVLNSPENRDSAYYSSTDASSKHTSAASCAGVSSTGPPSTSSMSSTVFRPGTSQLLDKTPSPTTNTAAPPQSLASPSTSSMSVASIVSPTSPSNGDLRRLAAERPQSFDSAPPSASLTATSDIDSVIRRESVESRINQGIGELRLSATSPYNTLNHSTTSVHNAFQAQQSRNSRSGVDSLSVHRISNGYQPSADRNPDGNPKATRTAPAITGPATSQIAHAAEPTKGQAWAFPADDIQRMPSEASEYEESRRSSLADSLASSQFTGDSRMISSQRRFDESSIVDYQRFSGTSSEYPTTHHHALQHKQLDDVQSESGSTHAGSQPYSRTPELRISHKLAERKRRTEMKELFEQLRDLMPQERGSKASKWEILTKAITEHQRQQDALRMASQHSAVLAADMAAIKNEMAALRMENQQLRSDIASLQGGGGGGNAHAPALPDSYSRGPPSSRPELPPLRNLSCGLPPPPSAQPPLPESMTGVQYDQSRINGFRQPERYLNT